MWLNTLSSYLPAEEIIYKAFDDVCGKCLTPIKKERVGIYLLTVFI